MKKIVTVIGARPQFIKASVVSRALKNNSAFKEIIVHTGQHYDKNMSQIFFEEMKIPTADYQLTIQETLHGKQTARMLEEIEKILLLEKPDIVLIYGDTNSTLAAALAAAKLHIPIAHIEAGLRSYNRNMPEEINRLVADQLATLLFAPTKQAVINLKNEGYQQNRIFESGDVMYDVSLLFSPLAEQKSTILHSLGYKKNSYILATIHRAENTDNPAILKSIFTALNKVSNTYPIVLPLHPRTRKMLQLSYPDILNNTHIQFIEPIGFLDMLMLEKNAGLIMTDSGGIQKEAFFHHVPCITLRTETEWIETVDLEWNHLVAPDNPDAIYHAANTFFGSTGKLAQKPYGDGNAAKMITDHLSNTSVEVCFFA